MNIFNKIKFFLKKPKVVIVTGEGRAYAKEAILQVLKPHFKIGDEVLILESDLTFSTPVEKVSTVRYLLKNSPLPVLVVSQVGNIPPDKDFFAGEKEKLKEVVKLAKILPSYGRLILNYDDETVRGIKDETTQKETTFGFGQGADFMASDVILNSGPARNGSRSESGGTNFKVNERGSVVPVWLEGLFGKEHIYATLAAAAVGTILGLNLVEISQALKNYQPADQRQKVKYLLDAKKRYDKLKQ